MFTLTRSDGWETVPCACCGSDDPEVLFEAGVAQRNRIVQCRCCGLMYASPRQRTDAAVYQEYEPEGLLLGVEADPDHAYRWKYDKERLQVRDYDRLRMELEDLHPKRGRLLEVGCSLGQLLLAFSEQGWDVTGLDPWREAALYVRKTLGVECHATTLDAVPFQEGSFDVVVMLHVIEHVSNPRVTLEQLFRLLKPGGHLVLETPRYDTVTFRLLGKRERSLSCDGHVYFFTTEDLRRMAEITGFEVVKSELPGRSLTAGRLLWNIGVMSRSKRLRDLVEGASHRLKLDQMRLYINLHDMVRMVLARPPASASSPMLRVS